MEAPLDEQRQQQSVQFSVPTDLEPSRALLPTQQQQHQQQQQSFKIKDDDDDDDETMVHSGETWAAAGASEDDVGAGQFVGPFQRSARASFSGQPSGATSTGSRRKAGYQSGVRGYGDDDGGEIPGGSDVHAPREGALFSDVGSARVVSPPSVVVSREHVNTLLEFSRTSAITKAIIEIIVSSMVPHKIDVTLTNRGSTFGPERWYMDSILNSAWLSEIPNVMSSLIKVGYCLVTYYESPEMPGEVLPRVIDPSQYDLGWTIGPRGERLYRIKPIRNFAAARLSAVERVAGSEAASRSAADWLEASKLAFPVLHAARTAVCMIAKNFGAEQYVHAAMLRYPKFVRKHGDTDEFDQQRGSGSGGGDGGGSNRSAGGNYSSPSSRVGGIGYVGSSSSSTKGSEQSAASAAAAAAAPSGGSDGRAAAHVGGGADADAYAVPVHTFDGPADKQRQHERSGKAGDSSQAQRDEATAPLSGRGDGAHRHQTRHGPDRRDGEVDAPVASLRDAVGGTIGDSGSSAFADVAAAPPPSKRARIGGDEPMRSDGVDDGRGGGDDEAAPAADARAPPPAIVTERKKGRASLSIGERQAVEAWPIGWSGAFDVVFDEEPADGEGKEALTNSKLFVALRELLGIDELFKAYELIVDDTVNRPLIFERRSSRAVESTQAGAIIGEYEQGFGPRPGAVSTNATPASVRGIRRESEEVSALRSASAEAERGRARLSFAGVPIGGAGFGAAPSSSSYGAMGRTTPEALAGADAFINQMRSSTFDAHVHSAAVRARLVATRHLNPNSGTIYRETPMSAVQRLGIDLPEDVVVSPVVPPAPPTNIEEIVAMHVSVACVAFGVPPSMILGARNARIASEQSNMAHMRTTVHKYQLKALGLFERVYWRTEGSGHLLAEWNAAAAESGDPVEVARSVAEALGSMVVDIRFSPSELTYEQALQLRDDGVIRQSAVIKSAVGQFGLSHEDMVVPLRVAPGTPDGMGLAPSIETGPASSALMAQSTGARAGAGAGAGAGPGSGAAGGTGGSGYALPLSRNAALGSHPIVYFDPSTGVFTPDPNAFPGFSIKPALYSSLAMMGESKAAAAASESTRRKRQRESDERVIGSNLAARDSARVATEEAANARRANFTASRRDGGGADPASFAPRADRDASDTF
jgi:hypothetical protein